jgi:hypothetical protein
MALAPIIPQPPIIQTELEAEFAFQWGQVLARVGRAEEGTKCLEDS